MLSLINYKDLEEMLQYFLELLPEPASSRIASVSKYARVNDEDIIMKAIKKEASAGFTWNFEITVRASS